jgi:hypothetical protein
MSPTVSAPRVALDLSALIGTWINTNTASRGVMKLEVAAASDGMLSVNAHAGQPWGSAMAHPYSTDGFEARAALAFNATFDADSREVRLQANIKAGVLVIAYLTKFKELAAGLSNHFAREFYYRSVK